MQLKIKKLSEMTPQQQLQYMQYYETLCTKGLHGFKVLKPGRFFDDNGLRFPVDYLNRLGINNVFFPLEIMAEYVDAVVKGYIDDNDPGFIYNGMQMISNKAAVISFESLNATAIGNMAYIALKCVNLTYARMNEALLNQVLRLALEKGSETFIQN